MKKIISLAFSFCFFLQHGFAGGSLSFDGADDYVSIGQVHYPESLTISAWIKSTTVAAGVKSIISDSDSMSGRTYQLEINRTAARVTFVHGITVVVTSNTDLIANTWYHVVLVRSGVTGNWSATIYLNGIADGTATSAGNPNTSVNDASIGRDPGGGGAGRNFPGLIADVHIYNRAMSASEVLELYSCSNSIFDALVGFWTFTDSMFAIDLSVNRRHGRFVGGSVTPSSDGPPINLCNGGAQ
jgi:hypothetical protein